MPNSVGKYEALALLLGWETFMDPNYKWRRDKIKTDPPPEKFIVGLRVWAGKKGMWAYTAEDVLKYETLSEDS